MKRILKLIAVIFICIGVASQNCVAAVNMNRAKEYKTSRFKPASLDMCRLSKDSSGKLISYYRDEDGINKKALLNSDGKSWEESNIKDSYSGSDGNKKWYTIYPDISGYVEISPNSKRMVIRNKKGKKTGKYNLAGFAGYPPKISVTDVKRVSENKYLLIGEKSKKEFLNVCVNVKKKKVLWTNKEDYRQVQVAADKFYSYHYDWDKIGNPSHKSDMIKVYRVRDGKLSRKIDATPIRNLVMQMKGTQTEYAYPLTDQQIRISVNGKKLYAAYMSGIFVYDMKSRKWNAVINGTKDERYLPAKDMEIVYFFMKSSRECYFLVSTGDYDGEVSEVLRYRW